MIAVSDGSHDRVEDPHNWRREDVNEYLTMLSVEDAGDMYLPARYLPTRPQRADLVAQPTEPSVYAFTTWSRSMISEGHARVKRACHIALQEFFGMDQPYDALLIVSFGGLKDDGGNAVSSKTCCAVRMSRPRACASGHHYELFGGVSPITPRIAR